MQKHLQEELAAIKEAGLYKDERIIVTPQKAEIKVKSGQQVLNFCANNYLGLSASPQLIEAAKKPSTNGVTACHPYVSFVAPKIFTKNWKHESVHFRNGRHHFVCFMFRCQ